MLQPDEITTVKIFSLDNNEPEGPMVFQRIHREDFPVLTLKWSVDQARELASALIDAATGAAG